MVWLRDTAAVVRATTAQLMQDEDEEDIFSDRRHWTCTSCTVVNAAGAESCEVCGAASHLLAVSISALAHVWRDIGYPPIASWKDLDTLPRTNRREFCLAATFHPRFIVALVARGCFPMTIPIGPENSSIPVMAIKLHRERCLIDLRHQEVHVSRKTRKRANPLLFSLNGDEESFDRALALLNRRHENNWMAPMLAQSLKVIATTKPASMRMLIWEVWTREGQLAAVEIGYAMGKIYTSMTGAFDPAFPGAGSVQLAVTSSWLRKNRFHIWDFGMSMSYKEELGARTVPRSRWLEIVEVCGAGAVIETEPKDGAGKQDCGMYLKVADPPRADLLPAMSAKELKDVAKTLGVSLAGASEKQEIVNLIKARILSDQRKQ